MKKIFTALVITLTIFSLSGCFPVFVPVHDHHHDRGHHRGW